MTKMTKNNNKGEREREIYRNSFCFVYLISNTSLKNKKLNLGNINSCVVFKKKLSITYKCSNIDFS